MPSSGARNVDVETVNHRIPFESGRHLWNVFTNSNPIGSELVAGLPEDRDTAAIEILDGMIRERSGGGGPGVLENVIHIAVGEA